MGLDSVELLMAAEETFDITITDAEAEGVVTVDDYYRLILSKLGERNSSRCLTAHTFYRLRRALAAVLGVERHTIKRDTRLHQLVPLEQRALLWRKVSKELGLQLPGLTRSDLLNKLLVALPLLSIGAAMVAALLDVMADWMAVALLLSGLATTYLLAVITRPWKRYCAQNMADMEGVTRQMLLRNFTAISTQPGGLSESELYALVVAIVSEQLGIPVSKIERHHRFVEDLGMD